MGKRQHQKDKLYITNKEWRTEWGGKDSSSDVGEKAAFRRLPFYCCSLSLQPFTNPYCTKDGAVFDLLNIVPFIKKFGKNPVNGEILEIKNLIKLNFHKNSEDKYHCPVTYKVFTQNSHIVAIKKTGNVFSFEAVEQLNIKTRNFKDLLTDEPFLRKDILTIQDPTNLEKFNLASFHHLKNNLSVGDEAENKAKQDPLYYIRKTNSETESILNELQETYKEPEKTSDTVTSKANSRNAAHYSTGMMGASLTSTARVPVTKQEAAIIDENVLRYKEVQKKGYVRLTTNVGDLNLELHCEAVPKTCENFLKLCASGYYDNTTFHRSIRNFMIQGGDPTATGRGGESAWGKPFEDEFKPNLTHTGRGILSMANSGENTNKSQFFITYRSCRHLDYKHSVFGRVVGGMDTLNKMEKIECDDKDRPKELIKIMNVSVFVNPFEEVDEKIKATKEKEKEIKKQAEEEEKKKNTKSALVTQMKIHRSGVGKYIPKVSSNDDESVLQPAKKKAKGSSGFGDFSSW
ncbi:RING-type E3 ubiquitin-protein ligase PPIL2-like [Xenia sp. Carnegie-2017]|uniref:RING-type E3 ubiquitin-protein ligase PPIL2-like n=1 Tax=Xenia sp. Carnegie-2017 TaxID=2897299 RepID=UPI001F048DAB|nr:RING-type E3 ubiquitin-protein ligase PPIL2-like [Xenia sp. Carnegie-2017]